MPAMRAVGRRAGKLNLAFRTILSVFWLVVALFSASCSNIRQGFSAPNEPSSQIRGAQSFRVGPILVSASLPPAVQDKWYASALSVRAGSPPYRFSIIRGSLPAGLSLQPGTGIISGVPAITGSFVFTVEVADDSDSRHGHRSLRLDVESPQNQISQNQISVTLAPTTATIGPGATLQLTAAVRNTSQTAVVWSASRGSISNTGLFKAPMQKGTVVVTATSAVSQSVKASAVVSVSSPRLTVLSSPLPNAQIGVSYSATIAAQGGSQPYNWSLSSGSLPKGVALNSATGVISGTSSQAGSFAFTVKVTDANSQSSTQQFALHVSTESNNSAGGATGPGGFDGPAELPRVYVQTTMADTPAPGNTMIVPAGSNLQAIVDSASCGDVIQLEAGASFSGNFKLPAKNCDDGHWIIIRTSAPDSLLPAEGTRINPCYAGVASLPGRPSLSCVSTQKVMARLLAGKSGPITIMAGANHYRLGPGLEITRPAGGLNYGLISPVEGLAIDHIILDRDWVHGTAQDDTTRGLFLSGVSYAAVIDSYFSDFHCAAGVGACSDSQAIAGGTGSQTQGIWKIVNNFLESSTEGMLFGGAPSSTAPTDIEIRRNHYFKPLIWLPGQPGFVGKPDTRPSSCSRWDPAGGGQCPFVVKNHLELKTGQRVLFEGNILENVWANYSQHGFPIVLSPLGTTTANATVTDVVIRYNLTTGSAAGINIAGRAAPAPTVLARISLHDNVLDNIDSSTYANGELYGPIGSAFELADCNGCAQLQDVLINHLTLLMRKPRLFAIVGAAAGMPLANISVTNNIVSTVPNLAVTGNVSGNACTGSTNSTFLDSCLGPYTFTHNALISGTDNWPSGNFFPANASAVGFVNYNAGNGGDYHLLPSSPYKNAATDSKDLGADVDGVEQAISGVR
jgi:Putative Ig domain